MKTVPSLVVQAGSGEFEGYAKAIGFVTPEKLTFQWSHDNPEVAFGRWDVTHDNFLVMKGSTGAAPAPGQTKKLDIDSPASSTFPRRTTQSATACGFGGRRHWRTGP